VREAADARNRKYGLGCAETVDDEDSLWKEKEKAGKIGRIPLCTFVSSVVKFLGRQRLFYDF
jgi:hypothetical protein